MLSFYLTRIPLGPTCSQNWPGWFRSPPTAAGFLGPSSFPGPAGHELGHSWQPLTPLLASAPQVTPGDFRASSWRSGVRGPGLSSPSAASLTQVGLTRDPHPASHWGFLETIWGVKKKNLDSSPQAVWAKVHFSEAPQLQAGEDQCSRKQVKDCAETGSGQADPWEAAG